MAHMAWGIGYPRANVLSPCIRGSHDKDCLLLEVDWGSPHYVSLSVCHTQGPFRVDTGVALIVWYSPYYGPK